MQLDLDPNLTDELWRRGELRWKLRTYQGELYDRVWDFLRGSLQSRKFYVDCHRRYGKSFTLFAIAAEVGLGKGPDVWPERKRIIRFSAPTMQDLEEIYHPIAEDLFEDCPDDIRPQWRTTRGRGHYLFPSTGSQLFLFGVDAKHYRKGRGKKCHLAVPDEIGSCEPGHPGGIEHVVNSILMPQTFGANGRIVMPTTPPETPGHSSEVLRSQCEAAGAYLRRSVYETEKDLERYHGEGVVEEYAREYGGRDTTGFRREMGCEHIVDEARAAVPEWEAHKGAVVCEFDEEPYFYPLVTMDPGFQDWHAILLGYWNFRRAGLDIVDEVWLRRTTTDTIAAELRAKERERWPWQDREVEKEGQHWAFEPWRLERRRVQRYSDTDLRLIADLSTMHSLPFAPTRKDEKEAQVNELRMFVKGHRLRIHPRCRNLLHDLATTVWNRQRTEWERTADGHHGDGVDALIYALRNAPRQKNPYPPTVHPADMMVVQPKPKPQGNAAVVASIFRRAQ